MNCLISKTSKLLKIRTSRWILKELYGLGFIYKLLLTILYVVNFSIILFSFIQYHQYFLVVHGGLSDWTAWSPCDRKCGGGWIRRLRACDNPSPKNGGRFCVGSLEEKLECNVHYCSGRPIFSINIFYKDLE